MSITRPVVAGRSRRSQPDPPAAARLSSLASSSSPPPPASGRVPVSGMESVRAELVRSYIRPPPNRTACDCCFDANCSRKPSVRWVSVHGVLWCSLLRVSLLDLTASLAHKSPSTRATTVRSCIVRRPASRTAPSAPPITEPCRPPDLPGHWDAPSLARRTHRLPTRSSAPQLLLPSCNRWSVATSETRAATPGLQAAPSHPARDGNSDTDSCCKLIDTNYLPAYHLPSNLRRKDSPSASKHNCNSLPPLLWSLVHQQASRHTSGSRVQSK